MKLIHLFSAKILASLILVFVVSCTLVDGNTIATNANNDSIPKDQSYQNSYISSDNTGIPKISSISRHEGSGRSLLLKSFLLAPLGLTILAIIVITLLPIPVVTIPTALGRNYVSNFYEGSSQFARVARDVLTSDSCVERVSCEISRSIKNFGMSSGVHKLVSKVLPISSQWKERMARGFDSQSSNCAVFQCSPQAVLKKLKN